MRRNLSYMRFLFVAFLFLGVISCSGYSRIDSQNWMALSVKSSEHIIQIGVPGGFYQSKDLYKSDGFEQLIALHYDFRIGVNVYVSPFGETRIYISTIKSGQIDELPELVAKESCARIGSDNIPSCVNQRLSKYRPQKKLENGWYKFDIDPHSSDLFTAHLRYYHKELEGGETLEFLGVVSGEAYRAENIREQRFQLLEDVLKTITISPLNESDT